MTQPRNAQDVADGAEQSIMPDLVPLEGLRKSPEIARALEEAYSRNPKASNSALVGMAMEELGPGFTTAANCERVLQMLRASGQAPAPGYGASLPRW